MTYKIKIKKTYKQNSTNPSGHKDEITNRNIETH